MTDVQGFLLGLVLTVVCLVAVIGTGVTAKRAKHLPSVVVFFATLAFTIYKAERMGQSLDVEAAGLITPVHLTMAKITVFSYVLPITTGILTWRNPTWRPKHRLCAWILIVMTLATVATGAWMAFAAEPLDG